MFINKVEAATDLPILTSNDKAAKQVNENVEVTEGKSQKNCINKDKDLIHTEGKRTT